MIQTSSPTIQDRSRLVRLLTDVSDAQNLSSPEFNLAQHMARLIGVSDSITLADALGQLPQAVNHSNDGHHDDIRQDVLSSRERMMRVIVESFTSENEEMPIQMPTAQGLYKVQALLTFEPYQRFYVAHQASMTADIQGLRGRVQQGISSVSAELSRLAELDRMLDDCFAHTRKQFNVIHKVLEQRFKPLLSSQPPINMEEAKPSDWSKPGGWLDPFYRDMRVLLLAELDVRLQPIIGLLEALNKHTDTV